MRRKGEKMRRILKLVIAALVVGAALSACSGQPAATTPPTSLPPVDLTAEAARLTDVAVSGTPPDLGTAVDTNQVTQFSDMQPGAAEIAVLGDLLSISAFPTSADSTIVYTRALNAAGTSFPPRQVIFNVDVRPGSDNNAVPGRLDVIFYIPDGVTGAQNVVKASSITPQQFGVALTLSGVSGSFLDVSDPNILALDGDMRVLETGDFFTAAFDITVINGSVNKLVRLVGRLNHLPYTP